MRAEATTSPRTNIPPSLAEELSFCIRAIVEGKVSDRILTSLLRRSAVIASTILRTNYWRQLLLFEQAGYTTESLSVRCIEELFLPRGGERCRELRQFYTARLASDSGYPAEELMIDLRRIIHRKILQTFPEILGEIDPDYRKILRNVRDVVRCSPGIDAHERFNEQLVWRKETGDPALHRPPIPIEQLLGLFCRQAHPSDTTATLVDQLLSIASDQETYCRALSVVTMAQIVRDYFALLHRSDATDEAEEEHGEEPDHGQLVEDVIAYMEEKYLSKYAKKGFPSDGRGKQLAKILAAYLRDLLDGDTIPLVEYFQRYFDGISYTSYRSEYRTRIEYLVQVARERLIAELRRFYDR